MTENLFRADDTNSILAAIQRRGIQVDPLFAGECRQLFGNPGTRMRYSRRDGLTVDGVAELLYDSGFLVRPVSTVECLDLLETLLTPTAKTRSRREAIPVPAKGRLRLYECEDCGKKLRVADDDLAALHRHIDADTFAETLHAFVRRSPALASQPF